MLSKFRKLCSLDLPMFHKQPKWELKLDLLNNNFVNNSSLPTVHMLRYNNWRNQTPFYFSNLILEQDSCTDSLEFGCQWLSFWILYLNFSITKIFKPCGFKLVEETETARETMRRYALKLEEFGNSTSNMIGRWNSHHPIKFKNCVGVENPCFVSEW